MSDVSTDAEADSRADGTIPLTPSTHKLGHSPPPKENGYVCLILASLLFYFS